ncbi:hypothetical protein BH11MYX4_BH11MYX4_38260 [soil metagenome]
MKLRLPSNERMVRFACVLALIALPLMVWSVFDPTVWPVLIALSVGQGLGTLSFAIFLVVVARDIQLKRKMSAAGSPAP